MIFAIILFLIIFVSEVRAYEIPSPNNRVGIHILFPEELEKAAKLVNSNGDWGYVTIPIQSYDHDLLKWQKFMDEAKRLHIIPIIRIATYPKGSFWTKPETFDTLDWPNFLNSLNWPTRDKLVILYNETNHANEWGGSVNPEEYAVHINNIIDQFKKRGPNFVLLNAALDLSAPNDAFVYFQRMNSAVPGIFKKFDGWASHSYPQPGFSGNPYEKGRKTILGYKEELAYLKNNFGVENIPVFITETGWKNTYLSQNEIADFYKKAFTEIWTEPNIIAVTPFLLHAGDGGFEGFSFLAPNGEEKESYKAIAGLPKPKGNPALSDNPVVLGESKTPEPLITPTSKKSFITLDNITKFLKWLTNL